MTTKHIKKIILYYFEIRNLNVAIEKHIENDSMVEADFHHVSNHGIAPQIFQEIKMISPHSRMEIHISSFLYYIYIRNEQTKKYHHKILLRGMYAEIFSQSNQNINI